MSGRQSPGLLLSLAKMRSQESYLYKCGGLHLSWVSVGLGGNMLRQVRETTGSIWFDRGEEEDDAAHNFKRSDHVLPIEIIFVISSTSSACIRVLLLG